MEIAVIRRKLEMKISPASPLKKAAWADGKNPQPAQRQILLPHLPENEKIRKVEDEEEQELNQDQGGKSEGFPPYEPSTALLPPDREMDCTGHGNGEKQP